MRPNIILGEFIIMPDHFHGILIITNGDPMHHGDEMNYGDEMHHGNKMNHGGAMHHGNKMHNGGAMHYRGTMHEEFGKPTANTIPSMIRGLKSTVTKQIKDNNRNHGIEVWQSSYYFRIIESLNEFFRTSNYIRKNPQNSNTRH